MLNQLADDLWETTRPLRFAGAQLGCRMTCVRVAGDQLVVHSPVRGSDELFAAVEGLGTVRWLVAPNALHHLFVQDWRARFPNATTLVAPKLLKKRKDLSDATPLSEAPPEEWGDELEALRIAGFKFVDETVFFHRPSATLVLTDLAFHVGKDSAPTARWLVRLTGRFEQLAPTRLERLMVSDKAEFRQSLQKVLEWPFERVVVSHGSVLESQEARDALARGFDWLQ